MCKKIIQFDTIDSTSTYLLNNASRLPNFCAVTAKYQTNGRGRIERQWQSEKGQNMLLSVLINEPTLLHNYDSVSLICAVSVCNVLSKLGVNNAQIKWPNDVYIGDAKICGILLESKDIATHMVVGIGLNVNQKQFVGTRTDATSVSLQLGKDLTVETICKLVIKEFVKQCKLFVKGKSNYHDFVDGHNYLLNKTVTVLIGNKQVTGKVIGVTKNNALQLQLADGSTTEIISGEATIQKDTKK